MKCPRCKRRIIAGERVQRYQFTSTAHRTVIAWVHDQCVCGFLLQMAKAVRFLGRDAQAPDGPPNILAL